MVATDRAIRPGTNEVWWNWIIPIGAFVVAVKFTTWYPDYLRGHAARTTGLQPG